MCRGLGVGEQRATPTCIRDPTLDAPARSAGGGGTSGSTIASGSKRPRSRDDQRREDHTARTQKSRAINPPVRSGVGGKGAAREMLRAGKGEGEGRARGVA